MIELIKPGTKFNFVRNTKKFLLISGVLIAVSILAMVYRTATEGAPLNLGIDFTGGTVVQVAFNKQDAEPISTAKVRETIQALGFASPEIQSIDTGGETEDFLVRIREQVTLINKELAAKVKAQMEAAAPQLGKLTKFDPASAGDRIYVRFDKDPDQPTLKKVFADLNLELREIERTGRPQDNTFTLHLQEIQGKIAAYFSKTFGERFKEVARAEVVGPKAGRRLRTDGMVALLIALGAILIYIAVRFDFRFAPGAVVALIHDVIITLGIFSLFWREFSLTTIAALLTIVGYSLNDTIVIFDRIREAFAFSRDKDLPKVTDGALNETLSRTLLTSLTTLLVVLSLFFLGGGLIQDFALALIIGVIVGTYSSIGVASPTMLWMDRILPKLQQYLSPEKAKAATATPSRGSRKRSSKRG